MYMKFFSASSLFVVGSLVMEYPCVSATGLTMESDEIDSEFPAFSQNYAELDLDAKPKTDKSKGKPATDGKKKDKKPATTKGKGS